jgi:aminopeptidase N
MYIRPDLWYNPVDGIKAGVHFEGDYLYTMHKVDASVWFNTHVLQHYDYQAFQSEGWYDRYVSLNYTFNHTSPITRWMPKLQSQINSRYLDGLWYHRAGGNWLVNGNNTLSLYGQTMWRALSYDRDYLIYKNEWSSGRGLPNSSLNASWTHRYAYKRGSGNYKLSVRAPFLTGNNANAFDYAYAQLEAVNNNRLGKLEIRTRLFGRYGTGNNIPHESALWLAGANPEELMDNKYTRTLGFIPDGWSDITRNETNRFQMGGGMNLRGYAGYFIADERQGNILIGYKGRSGASVSAEVDFDEYIKFKPKYVRDYLHLDAYLFADAGAIELSSASLAQYWITAPTTMWSDIRVDAGVGFALTIKKWGWFDKAKPLTLRFDMPIFLNRPPAANPEYVAFRYQVGINRTF